MSISIADRVFSATQRRAILLRDGACIIPGCEVPGAWCEIHHVTEHARGGATTTDNGVLLCWHHHRTLEGSGWAIRMTLGVPEVRGPSWWDATGTWRRVTRSPIRLRRQHRLARQ
ncbi:HNH endonuclease [Microbacterium sp. cx-55]|nr:HNH endonuclease [Microbacterium sp. cx-55]UGB36780.1 HNH endonuclease [Microbacterium sp. cx-55]